MVALVLTHSQLTFKGPSKRKLQTKGPLWAPLRRSQKHNKTTGDVSKTGVDSQETDSYPLGGWVLAGMENSNISGGTTRSFKPTPNTGTEAQNKPSLGPRTTCATMPSRLATFSVWQIRHFPGLGSRPGSSICLSPRGKKQEKHIPAVIDSL